MIFDSRKIASIPLIYKAAHIVDYNSYRVISSITILSETVYEIVNARLLNYFNKYSIITLRKYGSQKRNITKISIDTHKENFERHACPEDV